MPSSRLSSPKELQGEGALLLDGNGCKLHSLKAGGKALALSRAHSDCVDHKAHIKLLRAAAP